MTFRLSQLRLLINIYVYYNFNKLRACQNYNLIPSLLASHTLARGKTTSIVFVLVVVFLVADVVVAAQQLQLQFATLHFAVDLLQNQQQFSNVNKTGEIRCDIEN